MLPLPPRTALGDGMKAKTFDDWKLLGYCVSKGQKATGRDKNGKATFTRDQVEECEERFCSELDEREALT